MIEEQPPNSEPQIDAGRPRATGALPLLGLLRSAGICRPGDSQHVDRLGGGESWDLTLSHPRSARLGASVRTVSGLRDFVRRLALNFRLQYERPFWRSLGWTSASVPFLWNVACGMGAAFIVALMAYLIHTPTSAIHLRT